MSRRGQAAVEAIAVTAAVAAIVAAAIAAGAFTRLPAVAARAFDDGRSPSAAELAYLDRAVARPADANGPALADAIRRLAPVVGADRARALAVDRLLRTYAVAASPRREALADPSWALTRPAFDGDGPGTEAVWSIETERAPAAVRLIDPGDEARWADRQRPSTVTRAVDVATAAAIAAAGAVGPEVSLAALVLGAGAAVLEEPERGIPAGSRDGDAIVCRFVWRRNAAAPGWAADHPVDALRLALDERLPAVELTVVRAGQVCAHAVVRSHATTC